MVDTDRSLSGQGRLFDAFLVLLTALAVLVIIVAAVTSDGAAAALEDEPAAPEPVSTLLDVNLTEFAIGGDLVAPTGEVQLAIANAGSVSHNVVLTGLNRRTADLTGGQEAILDLGTLGPGRYEIICDIPGHVSAGMRTALLVTDADGNLPETPTESEPPDWEALDQIMEDSILEYPAETEGLGNRPLEPTILDDGTKEFRLTTSIVPWEVEPGKFVDAWTYNGQVPGPAIRVDIGDRVRVILDNQLPMGTDVHWHGVDTPNDQDGVAPLTQPLIRSGESYTYEFVADSPAVGMYHAHHHAQIQVPNGLFGVFQIGEQPVPRGQTVSGIPIPEDLEVAHEIPMVLNDAGVIGFSLNGKSFPATEPYVVQQGDWMLVTYYNEGLVPHPMHMHQFPQIVFAKDGLPLDVPYAADTINVAPGERYSVLVQATDPGVWVWHCHVLTHVESDDGMFGMVTAVIVEAGDHDAAEAGHGDEADHDDEGAHDDAATNDDVVQELGRIIEVDASEFAFSPDAFEVVEGETVTFRVRNVGLVEHEFRVTTLHEVDEHLAGGHDDHHGDESQETLVLVQPGEVADLTLTFEPGVVYELVACLLPDHYEAGMAADLTIG